MRLASINKHKLISTSEEEVTEKLVNDVLEIHDILKENYIENEDMYLSDHAILHSDPKPEYKPDNRLVINYPKYIVDSFGGFHLGIPLKISHQDETVDEYISYFRKLNDMEDKEYEVGKDMDIFGHSFIYLYRDESEIKAAYESPTNMAMVYDNSIIEKPFFSIRYGTTDGEIINGEVTTDKERIYFTATSVSGVKFTDREPHYFTMLPVIEFVENEERQAIFESVKTLVNALNKAATEKANDVDYFSDAYLKVIGKELEEEEAALIPTSRIINLFGDNPNLNADFMEKPNADTTQENLITLLKESIFSISMVANMNEENFGQSSGTALAFKLQSMNNLAKVKDRKMQSGFNRMYQVIFGAINSPIADNAWKDISYTFTRNVPKNLKEEAEVVKLLDGQVSDETKISYLSTVDNAAEELKRIEEEKQAGSRLMQAMEMKDRMTDDALILDEKVDEDGDK